MWTADLRWIFVARGARSIAYGMLTVILGVYLARQNVPAVVIGGLFSVALAGDAALTFLLGRYGDRIGRRRTMLYLAAGMAVTGLVFAVTSEPAALLATAFFGTLSVTSNDSAPFTTLEQAILPQLAPDSQRTAVFSHYNTIGAVTGSIGTLLGALPGALALSGIADELLVMRLMLLGYAALAVPTVISATRLTDAVELGAEAGPRPGLHRSRRTVYGLAALFALDTFASGFALQSFVVYWFTIRFGVGTEVLGPVFFVANLINAASYPAALWIASRIGLVNTMVFTHLPANILLMLIPFATSLPVAIALLFARTFLSRMDLVPRQSYVAAVVDPSERTAAAAYTNLARSVPQTVSPVLSGLALSISAFGLPFFLCGGLKIVYDLALLAGFRRRKPPEEVAR